MKRKRPEAVRATTTDEGVEIRPEGREKGLCVGLHAESGRQGDRFSLIYRILESHDGPSDVSSEVGRGAIMSVRFPAG